MALHTKQQLIFHQTLTQHPEAQNSSIQRSTLWSQSRNKKYSPAAGRSSVQGQELMKHQLLPSCSEIELRDSLLKANPKITDESLPTLLAAMHALAVIPVATCVLRSELLQLRQEQDKPFLAKCSCGDSVDYTDHIICDIIMNSLYNTDICREVLGLADILEKPVNDVIALVETKEMARNALPSSNLSAMK